MTADSTLDSTLDDLEHEPAAEDTEWEDAGWNDWEDAMDMETGPVHDIGSETGVDVEHDNETEYTYITRHEDVELQDGSVVHHEYDATVEDSGDWQNLMEEDWTNVEGDVLNIDAHGDTQYNVETGELETDIDIYQQHEDGTATDINYDHDSDFHTGEVDTQMDTYEYGTPSDDGADAAVDTSAYDSGADAGADDGADDY